MDHFCFLYKIYKETDGIEEDIRRRRFEYI